MIIWYTLRRVDNLSYPNFWASYYQKMKFLDYFEFKRYVLSLVSTESLEMWMFLQ